MELNVARFPRWEDFGKIVERLRNGERFVILFSRPLRLMGASLSPTVFPDDLLLAQVVLADGVMIPLLYVTFMVGQEPSVGRQGTTLVQFASWAAAVFCRQFAGVVETSPERDFPTDRVMELVKSVVSPDLWLEDRLGKKTLRFFDPVYLTYREIEAWPRNENGYVPASIEATLRNLTDLQLWLDLGYLSELAKFRRETGDVDQRGRIEEEMAQVLSEVSRWLDMKGK